ncbi:hypothetical protein Tco_0882368 [Tanacetum coccineum]
MQAEQSVPTSGSYTFRKSWLLFKSKKIAQVVSAWIQSKNSLVKNFEDMRLCRPSKEYLQVWFDPPRDVSMSCLTTKVMHTIGEVSKTYKNPSQSHTYSSNLSNCHSSLQALISLTDDLSLLSNMAALESCPKHNMIAYLEKTEGNVEFHEVIDFLRRSYIYHALTVSPVVSTTFVEQFWTSAKSKTINNVLAQKLAKVVARNEDDLTLQMSMIFVISLCQQGGKKKMGESSVKEVPLFDVMLEDKIDTWKQKMLKVKGGKFKKEWEAEEARIEADRILAEKLQEQEREQFTIEERAKFLHDTIAAQRKFPCLNKIRGHKKQTSNKNQLGYQMSDLLIACGDFNILELKSNLTTGLDESKRSEEINNECVTRSMVKEIASKNLDKSAFSVDRDRLRCFHEWKVVSWKLHSSSGVHTLMTDEGLVVHMLIEKKYPLKKEILMQMLKLKLESEEESTMALELIRFIKKGSQLTLLLGEELASPRSNSSCIGLVPNTNDEELSIPEQTATGKGTSNPLMAGCAKEGSEEMAPKKRTIRASPATTTTTTPVTNAQLKALIDQGIADALAAHDADRRMNGDDSHN